jgi:hypothetical protein
VDRKDVFNLIVSFSNEVKIIWFWEPNPALHSYVSKALGSWLVTLPVPFRPAFYSGLRNLSSTLKGGLRLFFGFKISLRTYLGLRYSEIILYIRK